MARRSHKKTPAQPKIGRLTVRRRGRGKVMLAGLGLNGKRSLWVRERRFHAMLEGYAAAPYEPMVMDSLGGMGL